jgi:hypothetical protein
MLFVKAHETKKADCNPSLSRMEVNAQSKRAFNSSSDTFDSAVHLQKADIEDAKRIRTGNIAFDFSNVRIQPKLKVSQPGDPYEQEADRVSEQVMRMSTSLDSAIHLGTAKDEGIDRKCVGCEMNKEKEKEGKALDISRKPSATSILEADDGIVNKINNGRYSSSSSLDASTKEFMESRFVYDFSNVRLHTGEQAAQSAQSVNALAYTVGSDIVFGEGQYRPNTVEGRRLLAHELTHVIQQSNSVRRDIIMRADPSNCSSGSACDKPDVEGGSDASAWILKLAVDREEKGLWRFKSGNVGHTWVILENNVGRKDSFGFWPQTFFDSSHPTKSVPGCVHHPDTAHEPPKAVDYIDISYDIPGHGWSAALGYARQICKDQPDYNLLSFNCTTFAINTAKIAGVSPPDSSTLAIHDPNALYEGIEEEKKKTGKKGGGSGSGKKTS